ncbi:MAG: nucleotidyltransferase domain-containing protein [Anaerolineae bacterium]|nr:nucleotidyltransferase domain-containing protein [Anaerolineae bacterium]
MKATAADRARLEAEVQSLVAQLRAMGAVTIILFGSLARGHISLFSDIDLLVLFEEERPARELTRRVYEAIHTGEAVDILAYSLGDFEKRRERPFFRKLLAEGKVLYERPERPET